MGAVERAELVKLYDLEAFSKRKAVIEALEDLQNERERLFDLSSERGLACSFSKHVFDKSLQQAERYSFFGVVEFMLFCLKYGEYLTFAKCFHALPPHCIEYVLHYLLGFSEQGFDFLFNDITRGDSCYHVGRFLFEKYYRIFQNVLPISRRMFTDDRRCQPSEVHDYISFAFERSFVVPKHKESFFSLFIKTPQDNENLQNQFFTPSNPKYPSVCFPRSCFSPQPERMFREADDGCCRPDGFAY